MLHCNPDVASWFKSIPMLRPYMVAIAQGLFKFVPCITHGIM